MANMHFHLTKPFIFSNINPRTEALINETVSGIFLLSWG
ncbi:hypothetical protein ADIARSV_1481 [Arcticibacter svalbardensis MN12-7]|uniref:Uncharacterized protein n=1 Tax=Arcticibacter svalbardensis MN12-7 TaxID=1150600 RepID=R9H2C3_9SPHI|nr:hypothetical protein ADIARSV_1481 [Arcticibacter svalbardensis MN12-7]